jgi:hypothetical protein
VERRQQPEEYDRNDDGLAIDRRVVARQFAGQFEHRRGEGPEFSGPDHVHVLP